jgi:hypothetical protein
MNILQELYHFFLLYILGAIVIWDNKILMEGEDYTNFSKACIGLIWPVAAIVVVVIKSIRWAMTTQES